MSNSDHYEVGHGRPPKHSRFSTENQPLRRKRKVAKGQGHNVLAHILRALNEDVSVKVNGKLVKKRAGDVMARRLVKQVVSGTLNEQLKFAGFLQAYGELDPEKIRDEIREEYSQEIQEERCRYSELLGMLRESVTIIYDLRSVLKLVSPALVAAKSKCSCDAFEVDEEVQTLLLAWSLGDDGELTLAEGTEPSVDAGPGWAPMSGVTFPSADTAGAATTSTGLSKDQQSFPVDDLSAGKIGND